MPRVWIWREYFDLTKTGKYDLILMETPEGYMYSTGMDPLKLREIDEPLDEWIETRNHWGTLLEIYDE